MNQKIGQPNHTIVTKFVLLKKNKVGAQELWKMYYPISELATKYKSKIIFLIGLQHL
jgi:hypothetical protein